MSCVEVGGEVDSLLLGGGYLFVGLHKGAEGLIKVWNMASGSSHTLTGHKVGFGGCNLNEADMIDHACGRAIATIQHATSRLSKAQKGSGK